MNFKEFFNAMDAPLGSTMTPPTPFGATSSDGISRSKYGDYGEPQNNRDFDLGLPTVTKTSVIQFIDEKTNPIFIYLQDGTKIHLPFNAFKRIHGEPRVGKTLTVVFQRRTDDLSNNPSQIQSITCH